MLAEQDDRPPYVESEACHNFFGTQVVASRNHVERWLADGEDAPRLFSQPSDAFGRILIGSEVKVRELGHSVSDRIVQGTALRVVAAFDMRRGNAHLSA